MQKLKFVLVFLLGVLLATSAFAFANQPIKLVVNGKEIVTDVPPQVINGRTLVPARVLAEALGASVAWDEAQNAVVVTGGVQVGAKPGDLNPVSTPRRTEQPTQKPNPSGGGSGPSPSEKSTEKPSLDELITGQELAKNYGFKFSFQTDGTLIVEMPKGNINISPNQIDESKSNPQGKVINCPVSNNGAIVGSLRVFLKGDSIFYFKQDALSFL